MAPPVPALMLTLLTATCPIADLVAARLKANTPYRYEVSLSGQTLSVRLLHDDHVMMRDFAAGPSCEENVRIATAVLSTWMIAPPKVQGAPRPSSEPSAPSLPSPAPTSMRVRPKPPEPAKPPKAVVRAPPPPPDARPSPDEPPAPVTLASPPDLAPLPPLSSAPAPRDVTSTPNPAAAPASTSLVVTSQGPIGRATMELSAEGGTSVVSSPSLAFAASGGVRLGIGRALAGFLEVEAASLRNIELGPGRVWWTRVGAGLGVRLRVLEARRFFLDSALAAQLAAASLTGSGFRENVQVVVPDVGACGHLRAGLRSNGPFEFFLGLRACGWPTAPSVTVGGLALTSPLPVLEGTLRLGVSYGWGL